MHLFSREHLAASSGIVGAPAPLACGPGFAAQQAGDARVAIAFFGDGAVNQGAVMESLNLASVWRLPVLFVCKDNRWAVTTRSSAVTAGGLRGRAVGMPVRRVDGTDVVAVHSVAAAAVTRARHGGGPTFVLVSFAVTTLAEEPGTTVALIVILLLSVVLDLMWKRRRGAARGTGHEPVPR
jgi:acetoin:2,6-dichlorophenolindophenol oxidoreductase subunit alpha